MAEPVVWDERGNPRSARFNDLYRSASGGLARARRVFLGGCGLPQAWSGHPQWRVLETGFGLGLNFLATWQAWKDGAADAARPGLLHYAAVEGYPVAADDIRRSAASFPELAGLADALCAQWHGLLPGVHRLVFEAGRVTLTLAVGDVRPALRALTLVADSVYLDGFAPASNPDMWSVATLKGVARCCRRGTRVASGHTAPQLGEALAECGFQVVQADGPSPTKHRLEGRYNPPWVLKRQPLAAPPVRVARCAVVGGGLAGAAVAASLARRGWRVQVLDATPQPAAGASGLPVGVLAPHVAVDDPPVSRLSRAGVRATRQAAMQHLLAGDGWQPGGVLEHRVNNHPVDGSPGLPAAWRTPDAVDAAHAWSEAAPADKRSAAGLPPDQPPALWHPQGGWVRPAKLVQALLDHEHIEWLGGCAVARLERRSPGDGPLEAELIGDEPLPWQLLDAAGRVLAEAELVVLAAGHATRTWLGADSPPLQAVRGQVSFGRLDGALAAALPPFPVNGHGSVVAGVPAHSPTEGATDGASAQRLWVVGASYERDADQPLVKGADHAGNLERLRELLPGAADALRGAFDNGEVEGWAGIRCTTPDRLPLVGPTRLPGVCVSTGMGSRGISLAVLCGELLAAWLMQEPLPVEAALAKRLHSGRFDKGAVKG